MSQRTVVQALVALLAVAALGLGVVLVVRSGQGTSQSLPKPERCELDQEPATLLTGAPDTLLVVRAEAKARLSLDEEALAPSLEAPQRFRAGPHVLKVECPNQAAFEEALGLEPYATVALYAACREGPVVAVLGADIQDWALGKWGDAAETAAAAASRKGDVEGVHKAAVKAGKDSGLLKLAEAYDRHLKQEREAHNRLLLDRWNALTERWARVMTVVGRTAPGAAASASLRFEELSAGFLKANAASDGKAQAESISAGEETLKVFVRAARRARPDDCDFQKRLTQSFESL